MEEKKSSNKKLIINIIAGALILAGILTLVIPLFNTPNYNIYFGNKTYKYNSYGIGLDSSNNETSIAYSEKVLKDNSNKNGYLIDLSYIRNDNSIFTLSEEYVDVIFETTFDNQTVTKAGNFELKSNDSSIKSVNVTGSGSYSILKVNIKELSSLEIYEKVPLTVLSDNKESTISYTKLNVKVIYFGR